MNPNLPQSRLKSEQGVVLIAVLWLLALLTLMAGSYSATTRTELRLTAAQFHAAQARGLAETGVWLGVQQLLQPVNASAPITSGIDKFPFGAGVITVQIQDEAGKIDLNTARPEILLGLLQSAGADTVQAISLRDAIVDWRDRDNLRRAAGAEDDDYRAQGRHHGAKDGPFNSVEELRAVLGMTEPLFQQMRSALTLSSHQPGIAGAVAVPQALAAVPGATPAAVDSYLKQRALALPPGAPARAPPMGMEMRYLSGRRSQTYALTSTGKVADTEVTIEATVQLRPAGQPPYAILSWREAPWRGAGIDVAPPAPERG